MEYTNEQVLEILKEDNRLKVEAKKFPNFSIRRELFDKYGIEKIRPGLNRLLKLKKIKAGHTINDFWIKIVDNV